MEKLYETYIEGKHPRMIKLKKINPITRRLQEVQADLWGLYKSTSILSKNFVVLLFDKFTRKLWILILKSKNKFFDIFQLWLPRTEVCKI